MDNKGEIPMEEKLIQETIDNFLNSVKDINFEKTIIHSEKHDDAIIRIALNNKTTYAEIFDYQKEIEHGELMLSCEVLTKDYSKSFTLYLDENKNVLES